MKLGQLTGVSLKILNHIKANPKCTNKEIASKFGLIQKDVASRTRQLENSGRIKREKVGTTLSGVAILGNIFVQSDAVRSVRNAKKPLSNHKKSLSKRRSPEYYFAEDTAVTDIPASAGLSGQKTSIHSSLMALSAALAEAIVGQVKSKLAVELSSLIPEPVPEVKLPSIDEVLNRAKPALPAPKKNLRRVCIAGMLPQQEGALAAEFFDCFDLSFYNNRNGDGVEKLKAMAKSCEVVLIHTNHASHKWQELVKSVGGKYKLVGGGMTQLRNMLTSMYVGADHV